MKLNEILQEIVTDQKDIKSSRVVESRSKVLLSLMPGNTSLNSIDYNTINKVKKLLQQDYKPSTSNAILSLLSKALKTAYERRLIDHKPIIGRIKDTNCKINYLSYEDENKILVYCYENEPILADIIILGINTGMRISEMLAIEPVWIEDNYIRIYNNKSDRPRSVPMNDKARKIIEKLSPNFFSEYNYNRIVYLWQKMRVEVGVSYTIHDLRHTFASRLVQKGVDLYRLQKLLGHSDIKMTQIYAHLRDQDLEEVVSLL